jgi:hypothetical protein
VSRDLRDELHAAVDGYQPEGDSLAAIVERGLRARRRDRVVRRSAVGLALCAVLAVAVPIAVSRPDDGPAVDLETPTPTPAPSPRPSPSRSPTPSPTTSPSPAPPPSPSPTASPAAKLAGLADLLVTGGPWLRVGIPADPVGAADLTVLGELVLVGGGVIDDDGASARRAAVWRSADGRDWQVQEVSQQESWISQIVGGPEGALAVGDVAGTPQAWWTPDGEDWTPAPPPPGLLEPPAVAWAGGQWLAFGTTLSPTYTVESRIYTSTDARTWVERPVPAVRNAFGTSLQVTVAGDLVVVVNRDDILRSRDGGSTWEAVPGEPAPPLTAARVAAMPDGTFLAVGILGTQSDASYATGLARVAFTSPDGVTWTRAGDVGTDIAVIDLAVLPDGIAVAVGGAPDRDGALRSAVWISYDGGVTWTPADLQEELRTDPLVGVVGVGGLALAAGPDNDGIAVWAGVP